MTRINIALERLVKKGSKKKCNSMNLTNIAIFEKFESSKFHTRVKEFIHINYPEWIVKGYAKVK